jgi:hypothetical protein
VGGSSKKQTIGYKYYLGQHLIFIHGPGDRLLRLQWDGKTAWEGDASNEQISVNAEDLFGGEKKEGGVSGLVDVENGAIDQLQNSYLQTQLGTSIIPAFRRVAGLILRKFYIGMNPYLKKMSARWQRIHLTTDGATQWYDAKAAIPINGSGTAETTLLAEDSEDWEYKIIAHHADPGTTNLTFPTSGTTTGVQAPFGSGSYTGWNTEWPEGTIVWTKRVVGCVAGARYVLHASIENGGIIWINGTVIAEVNIDNGPAGGAPFIEYTIPQELTVDGYLEVVCKAFDEEGAHSATRLQVYITRAAITDVDDMNPAHIIRECLVDPDWGMGYLEADIDDASFTVAADTLYDEGLGISILWDRQMPLEDFIKEIIRHIDAALYVSRTTGKFVLKLIRQDYDVNDLLVLNEDNVEFIENYTYGNAFGETINSVTVQYWDSETNTQGSVTESDPALVQMQGNVINTTIQYPGFTNFTNGSKIARRDLGALSRPLRTCTAYVNFDAKDHNIGDAVILDWPDFETDAMVMRIVGMALGNGLSNKIKLNLSQDIFNTPTSGSLDEDDDNGWEDPSVAPMAATDRLVFESPYYELIQRGDQESVDTLLEANPESGALLATAARPATGAINAELMVDAGAGYESQGNTDFCPSALLNGAISFDDTTFPIDGGTDLDDVELGTWCQIGDDENAEACIVTAVSDTSITLGRGTLDTVPKEHLDNARIFFPDLFAQGNDTEYVDGESVDVKLLTNTGLGKLLEYYAPVDTLTFSSRAVRPYPPAKLRIDAAVNPGIATGPTTVTWNSRDRVSQADQLVDTEEASVTADAHIRYALRILKASDESLIVEKLNIGALTASFDLIVSQDIILELYSIDDNGESWQRHRRELTYTNAGAVTDTITATDYVAPDDTIIIDGGGA